MSVIDPSGFQMNARVRVDEKIYNLWLGGAEGRSVDGTESGGGSSLFGGRHSFQDLPIVTSIEMELGLGLNGKVSIGITATTDLAFALMESKLFTIGNVVEVQMGYPKIGLFTPWFGGIQAKPSIQYEPSEGLTATMNVEGAAFSAIRTASSGQYEGVSYLDAIRTLSDAHGWNLRTVPSDLANAGGPINEIRSFTQGNMTDWRFIQQMARVGQCDAFMQPDQEVSGATALIVRQRANNPVPKIQFNARGQIDMVNVFPMFSFDSPSEGIWLPQGSGNVRCDEIDPDDRSEPSVEVNANTTATPRTADAVAGTGGRRVGDTQVELRGEPGPARWGERIACSMRDPRGPQNVADSHSDEQQARGGINANISSYGLPQIFPGQFVEIINFGLMSGNYGILSMTHRGEIGSFTTSFALLSNALFQDQIAAFLQEEAQIVNTLAVEPSNEAEGGGTTAVETESGADS